MAGPGEQYNDGAVPYGSFTVSLHRVAATLGTYILENFTVNRPTKKVERPNQIGGPNGFALVGAQETSSAVLQIATSATVAPNNGDFFTLTVDSTVGAEKWVIETTGQPFEMNGYYKQNITLLKAYF